MSVRRIFVTVVAAAASLVGFAGTAAPAHAATATSFCFTWAETGAPYAGYPVDLYQVDSAGNWGARLRSGKTNSSGCGTFTNTPTNVYLRVYANVQAGGHAWGGGTNLIANPGSSGVNLGRAYVKPIF